MKTIFSLLLIFVNLTITAQSIGIDVSLEGHKKQISIATGNYTFNMINIDAKSSYDIRAEKNDLVIGELITPNEFTIKGIATGGKIEIGSFELNKGQELKITIISDDGNGNLKTFIYIYQTEKRGEWRSTFGFNFVYLTNNNTYFSNSNDDNTFTITESNNKENFIYYPTLMFSWVSNNDIDKWKNWKVGASGGIGYDFKTNLSVFTGASLIYNENITITAGLAFHNQKRLSSNYSENDIINENLTFEQLHTDYIRVNPFVSISFRLDKNPFKVNN